MGDSLGQFGAVWEVWVPVWDCLRQFGCLFETVWVCLGMFGWTVWDSFGTCLERFRIVWDCLVQFECMFGTVWVCLRACLELFGTVRVLVGSLGWTVRNCLGQFGVVWESLVLFGYVWVPVCDCVGQLWFRMVLGCCRDGLRLVEWLVWY